MQNDLKSMSRKQLEKLIKDAEKALNAIQEKEKREALKAAEKAAAKYGFSLQDLSPGTETKPRAKTSKAKRPAKAPSVEKYQNPADASQKWTGKGRQPGWYKDAIAAGKTPEDMAI